MSNLPYRSLIVFLFSSMFLVSCGSDQRGRSKSAEAPFVSGGGDAQNRVTYCDDQVQSQALYAQNTQQRKVAPNARQVQNQGYPHHYQGERQCMRGADGEPLVDVRPGKHTTPGQRRDYRNYPNDPRRPDWQQPNTRPRNPRTPQDPRWQTPNNNQTRPQPRPQPRQPNWQQPNQPRPNQPRPGQPNPNQPNWQQPQTNPEPLPY